MTFNAQSTMTVERKYNRKQTTWEQGGEGVVVVVVVVMMVVMDRHVFDRDTAVDHNCL